MLYNDGLVLLCTPLSNNSLWIAQDSLNADAAI